MDASPIPDSAAQLVRKHQPSQLVVPRLNLHQLGIED